jgi:hypothetical protein
LSQDQFAYRTERSSGPWSGSTPQSVAADEKTEKTTRLGLATEEDTYGIKVQCEANERCLGFRILSGCVTFMLSSDIQSRCRAASNETDYGGAITKPMQGPPPPTITQKCSTH